MFIVISIVFYGDVFFCTRDHIGRKQRKTDTDDPEYNNVLFFDKAWFWISPLEVSSKIPLSPQ